MRILLLVVLLLFAAAASAEWTRIGVSGKPGDAFTLYVDIATVQREGKLARIWDLQDFSAAQTVDGKTFRSEKTQIEFDCESGRARVLAIIDIAGPMATGELVYSDGDPSEWTAVAPNTLGALEMKAACAVKP